MGAPDIQMNVSHVNRRIARDYDSCDDGAGKRNNHNGKHGSSGTNLSTRASVSRLASLFRIVDTAATTATSDDVNVG